MWIFSEEEDIIINSNNVSNFYVAVEDYFNETDSSQYCLFADGDRVCAFFTEDEAKKELKQIYDALIAGQESYSIG